MPTPTTSIPMTPGYYWLHTPTTPSTLVWVQNGIVYFGGPVYPDAEVSSFGRILYSVDNISNGSYTGPVPSEVALLTTVYGLKELELKMQNLRLEVHT